MDTANPLVNLLRETWWLASEMAPYLILGFSIAGLLRVFFTEEWVRRHLGRKGFKQILKAVVIGIPLPLCSCGVIPVAAGIRRQGGQRGAVAAFTAATPQTGVDAIAATVGMLGWVFALVRVGLALINGVVAGLIVDRWGDGTPTAVDPDKTKPGNGSCCAVDPEPASGSSSCCSTKEAPASSCCADPGGNGPSAAAPSFASRLASGFHFGLVTLPRDLFGPLVLGLVLAGMISAFAPPDLFANLPGGLLGVYIGITLISLPLYICSTGSIPMGFTFLAAGMSPGAVLIFLIAGPACNMASVTALWKLIGTRGAIGYVVSILATSWIAAAVVDFGGLSLLVSKAVHQHDYGVNLFQQAAAGLLILMLLHSRYLAPWLQSSRARK
jgi:uncharacterized membrane protein YraQ (UPF0718 family)